MEQKLKDFIQSSFLTEVVNNQTTVQTRNDIKTVQFEVDSALKRLLTALWICRFIDAQLPPQMTLFNHQQNIFHLHV